MMRAMRHSLAIFFNKKDDVENLNNTKISTFISLTAYFLDDVENLSTKIH